VEGDDNIVAVTFYFRLTTAKKALLLSPFSSSFVGAQKSMAPK